MPTFPSLAQNSAADGLPASVHMETTMKTCCVCKRPQPLDQFYSTSSECKDCGRGRSRERYHRNKSRTAAFPRHTCGCGCGELTEIAIQTDSKRGYVAGQAKRYKNRHHRRLSAVEYLVEDRGYKTPCWIWQRAKDRDGYGMATNPGKPGSRRAHTAYYEAKYGPIPHGLVPDHLCRVPSCVNPDHIEPVTVAVNTRRGNSAKLNEQDVIEIKRRLAAGEPQQSLAQLFGVSQSHISTIKRGGAWN